RPSVRRSSGASTCSRAAVNSAACRFGRSSFSCNVVQEYGDHGMTCARTRLALASRHRSSANSTARREASLRSTPTTTVPAPSIDTSRAWPRFVRWVTLVRVEPREKPPRPRRNRVPQSSVAHVDGEVLGVPAGPTAVALVFRRVVTHRVGDELAVVSDEPSAGEGPHQLVPQPLTHGAHVRVVFAGPIAHLVGVVHHVEQLLGSALHEPVERPPTVSHRDVA